MAPSALEGWSAVLGATAGLLSAAGIFLRRLGWPWRPERRRVRRRRPVAEKGIPQYARRKGPGRRKTDRGLKP